MQPVSFRHLLSCLSARSRNTTTDRTARAAAASALSVGVANGAEFLNLAFVERLCRHVVCALDLHAQTFDVPRLEMLSVLRAVMAHTASLFPVVWPCVRDTLHHPIEDGVVLHAVRVVQTFMQCRLDELKQGKQLLQLEPMLICQVYDAMLSKFVALVHMHTVQISAIAAVDAAAQLLVATSMQRDLPLEICSQLQFVVLSQDVRSVVQVAAVRALGNVSITSHTNIYSLFMFLQRIIRSQKYHITVRSRAMASVSTLLNCVAQTTHGAGLRAFVSENGVFAARCLEHLDVLGGVHAAASAADRAGQEAAKVAAVNLLAACVCVLGVVRKENEESGDERRRMMEVLGVTLMKEEESVNTRCQCCKAICHIIDFQKKHDVMSLTDVVEGVLETIRRAVSWKQPVRLQIFAAKVMKDITGFSMSNTGRVGILQTCCACFHEHALALERCDAIERGREHIASLRDVLSEVVCIVFRDVERECVSELMDGVDERFADVVVECVARHLVLPIRMLREERGKWMEGGGSADCWGEGKGLQDLLTEEAKGIVEKVLLAVKVMKKT